MKNAQAVMAAVLAGRVAPYMGPVSGAVEPVAPVAKADNARKAKRMAKLCKRIAELVK